MTEQSERKKQIIIYDEYGEVLEMPDLTDKEIDELRKPTVNAACSDDLRACLGPELLE